VHQQGRAHKPKRGRRGETREKRAITWEGIIEHEIGKRSSQPYSKSRGRGVAAAEIYRKSEGWIRRECERQKDWEAKEGLRSRNTLTLEP